MARNTEHRGAVAPGVPEAQTRGVDFTMRYDSWYRPLAWGVHASVDGWLVNGSRDGIVEIRFAPPIRPARAPLPTGKIGSLQLSLTDPDGFIAACKQPGPP